MCDLIATDLPRIGAPGDLIYAPNGIQLHVGGHAANVSVDLTQLGCPDVAVAGCIGDDVLGDFIEGQLRQRGLNVYAERLSGVHTSKNLALVIRGEDRRFYAELAANTMLSPNHVLATLEETQPSLFYQGTVGGLRFVDGSLNSILGGARELSCLTVVDVIRPHDGGWRRLRESLPLIDVLHCNNLESAIMAGEKDPWKAADILIDGGVGLCLITFGSEGLMAAVGETRLKMPPFRVEAVDPTGAGDAFCAGVMEALIRASVNHDNLVSAPLDVLKNILLEGAAAGAACVTAAGATTAVTRKEVDQLIKEQEEVWGGVEHI
jgi:sugar/nucleoside kinase (ribokinase family)